jgi:hypothetical protein
MISERSYDFLSSLVRQKSYAILNDRLDSFERYCISQLKV